MTEPTMDRAEAVKVLQALKEKLSYASGAADDADSADAWWSATLGEMFDYDAALTVALAALTREGCYESGLAKARYEVRAALTELVPLDSEADTGYVAVRRTPWRNVLSALHSAEWALSDAFSPSFGGAAGVGGSGGLVRRAAGAGRGLTRDHEGTEAAFGCREKRPSDGTSSVQPSPVAPAAPAPAGPSETANRKACAAYCVIGGAVESVPMYRALCAAYAVDRPALDAAAYERGVRDGAEQFTAYVANYPQPKGGVVPIYHMLKEFLKRGTHD